MGTLKFIKKEGSTNALRKSPLLGSSLATLGINKALPLHHGCQGCTAFTKNMLTAHFNEIVPIQTTASNDIATIMSKSIIEEAVQNILSGITPELIAVLSTTLVETKGEDIAAEINDLATRLEQKVPVIYINCSDYTGDAENGFSNAIYEIAKNFAKNSKKKNKNINILTNFSTTCGDILQLKEILRDFNLKGIFLPDITSLSGIQNNYYKLPTCETSLDDIGDLASSFTTICIGQSMLKTAEYLKDNFDIPFSFFPSLTGVKYMDNFLNCLEEITGIDRLDKYKLERNILIDSMLDCHFYTSNKYISIAAEPDLLFSLSYFLVEEMGSKLETAITTNSSDIIESIPTPNVYVGDLDDLEKEMKKSELIISNTNGLIASKKSEVPIYFAGFPVKNRFGYHLKNFIGYKGTREFLFDITNIFFEREEEKSFMKIV